MVFRNDVAETAGSSTFVDTNLGLATADVNDLLALCLGVGAAK